MSDRDEVPGPDEDAFAISAGAYVLGALSPAERAAFEVHLRTCRACEQEVADVAGLPGLLGRVPLDIVESLDDPAAVAPDLLPGLLRTVRVRRRRSRALAASAVGLAAACAIGLVIVVGTDAGSRPTAAIGTSAAPAPSATMTSLIGGLSITATASLTTMSWGTTIHMSCFYPQETDGQPWPYVLVAIDAAGHAQQVASWTAIPGRDADVWGSTSLQRSDIRELEVRTTAGAPILRLAV